MFISSCCFLTCIQISQEASKVIWYFHLLKNFSQFVVIHTVKGFGVINKGEVDAFLEFSCFFYDPVDVGNLISGSSAFSKTNSYIWKFSVHVLLKPSLKNFEHNLSSMWNEHSCKVVWTLFGSTHGHHQIVNTKIRLIIFFTDEERKALYSPQTEDLELTAAQIISLLLQNSGLNWRK